MQDTEELEAARAMLEEAIANAPPAQPQPQPTNQSIKARVVITGPVRIDHLVQNFR